jgi:Zn-dependent protease
MARFRAYAIEMRASWRLAKIAGIDVHLHVTFLLLLGVIGVIEWIGSNSLVSGLGAVLMLCAVFASVLAHELGHALTARYFRIGTRDITLLPIGGVARLERDPENPRHELAIALAGPIVSALLFVVFGIVAFLLHGTEPLSAESLSSVPFLERLAGINFALAAFNMLPAFPMDGGRALRAALSLKWGALRATEQATQLGRVLAVGLGVLGLFVNPMLVLIAAFVWFAGGRELAAVQARHGSRVTGGRSDWRAPPIIGPGRSASPSVARPAVVVARVRRPWYAGS